MIAAWRRATRTSRPAGRSGRPTRCRGKRRSRGRRSASASESVTRSGSVSTRPCATGTATSCATPAGSMHSTRSAASFVRDGADPRPGNELEVLIDGAEALPRIAEELARARSHVHLTGWFISPELQLTREEEPVIVRNLLAELAERIDVRVLLWQGAPVPAFRPSRADVRNAVESLVRHTRIKSAVDGVHRPHALPPREDDRDRRPRRLRRRDRPDARRRRPLRHRESPCPGRHRVARRGSAARGPVRRRRRGALPPPLAVSQPARSCRSRRSPSRQAAWSSRSRARCPRRRIAR